MPHKITCTGSIRRKNSSDHQLTCSLGCGQPITESPWLSELRGCAWEVNVSSPRATRNVPGLKVKYQLFLSNRIIVSYSFVRAYSVEYLKYLFEHEYTIRAKIGREFPKPMVQRLLKLNLAFLSHYTCATLAVLISMMGLRLRFKCYIVSVILPGAKKRA